MVGSSSKADWMKRSSLNEKGEEEKEKRNERKKIKEKEGKCECNLHFY